MFLMSVCTRSYAGEPVEKLPAFKGVENFKRNFPQAANVQCKHTNDLTEVTFLWQGLQLEVFYDKEGNTVATSRELNPRLMSFHNWAQENAGRIPLD